MTNTRCAMAMGMVMAMAMASPALAIAGCTAQVEAPAPGGDGPVGASSEALRGIPYGLAEYAETGIASGVGVLYQPGLVSTPTELFWSDASGNLQWKHYDNTFRWQPARAVPAGSLFVAGTPSAVATDVNEWRLFVSCADGSFWYLDYLGGGWLAPQMIGPPGTTKSGTSVSATYDGWSGVWRVYFVAPNGHILETSYTGGPWWSGGYDLGAVSSSAPSAVLRRSNGQLNVFFRGTNGHLFDEWFDGAAWHAAWDHGIAMTGDPAAIVTPDDSRIDVYFTPPRPFFGPALLESTTWTTTAWWQAGVTHGIVLNRVGAQRVDDVFGIDGAGKLAEGHPQLL